MLNNPSGISFRAIFTYIKFKLRLPKDKENIEQTIESVKNGATLTGSNLWVLVTAIFIASLGLNVNSTAVIIGAMLISPLMGPIMAIGMGVAMHDFPLVYRSLKNFVLSVGISIAASTLFFFISPLKAVGSELLARTTPTIYDVLIAIFGGLAGIIAGSSKLRQSNVIPGVAIATALMPPLCTVGFGIANLNANYIIGALYLFFINCVFISLSTYFIVRLLQYPQVEMLHERRALKLRRTIWFVVLLAFIPSIYLTVQIVRRYIFEEKAKVFVAESFKGQRRIVLETVTNYKSMPPSIELTILGPEIDSVAMIQLTAKLKDYGLGNADIKVKQGFGDETRRGQLGTISATMENNNLAINELYLELDSLKKLINTRQSFDSLQAQITRESKLWMPELGSVWLEQITFYDANALKQKNGWVANFSFQRRPSNQDLTKLRNWLNTRMGGDTLILRLN